MNVKTYTCDVCGKTYLRSEHRNVHEAVAHRDQDTPAEEARA